MIIKDPATSNTIETIVDISSFLNLYSISISISKCKIGITVNMLYNLEKPLWFIAAPIDNIAKANTIPILNYKNDVTCNNDHRKFRFKNL